MNHDDPLNIFRQISTTQAAEFLGVVPRTMEKLRQEGGGPRFVRVSSKCVRYRVADLITWQEPRLRDHSAGTGAAA